jgi:hypothetical protein
MPAATRFHVRRFTISEPMGSPGVVLAWWALGAGQLLFPAEREHLSRAVPRTVVT